MRKSLLFVTLIACSLAALSQADTISAGSLEEVVVTANRFPQKQGATGKVVTIINREAIERAGGMTLGDLLNRQAGITIAGANKNSGTNQDVYMRGAATGNTLILLDGVPMYDVSTINNTFDLNHIPLDVIERIEILKGAQSTVYGSDAVAGVIHIITQKQAGKNWTGHASVSGGSFGTLRGSAGIRAKAGKNTMFEAFYADHLSQGISVAYDSTGNAGFDKDAFRQQMMAAHARVQVTDELSVRLGGMWGKYKTELDISAFRDERDYTSDNHNLQADAGIEWKKEKFTVQGRYQRGFLERTYLNDSVHRAGFARFVRDEYKGLSSFAEMFGRFSLSNQLDLIAGVDARFQHTDQELLSISSFGPYRSSLNRDSARISLYGAYASVLYQNNKGFHLEAGGRYNQHSRFGGNATFTFNPSYSWKNGWQAFFNVSSAFKSPSLYQLYDATVGEQTLQPETSRTYEAGIRYAPVKGHWNIRAVVFDRNIRSGIDFNYVDYRYYNYNSQQARGAELEAGVRKGRWDLAVNYAYVTGQVNTIGYAYDRNSFSYVQKGDTTYDNLFRRPRHSVSADLGLRVTAKLSIRFAARIVGARLEPQFMAAPIPMAAYQAFDISTEYRLNKAFKLFADVRNITNAKYFDVWGFNARPIHVMTGIRWSRR